MAYTMKFSTSMNVTGVLEDAVATNGGGAGVSE
jgi:hypothetical protein